MRVRGTLRTPSNTLEFGSQSKLIRERIQRHGDSSPTSMVDALNRLTKGAEMMAHSLVLVRNQVAELQAANEAATRRKSHKRKRIQIDGTLIVSEGVRLTTLKEFNAPSDGKKAKKRARVEPGTQPLRRWARVVGRARRAMSCLGCALPYCTCRSVLRTECQVQRAPSCLPSSYCYGR